MGCLCFDPIAAPSMERNEPAAHGGVGGSVEWPQSDRYEHPMNCRTLVDIIVLGIAGNVCDDNDNSRSE